MKTYQGIPVSPGFAEGTLYFIDQGKAKIPKYWLHDTEVDDELKRYRDALETSKKQLTRLKTKLGEHHQKEHLLILEGHLAMFDDLLLTEDTTQMISKEKINAEWALSKTLQKILEAFTKIDEEYFLERQADISQVIQRVQNNLLGKKEDALYKIDRPVILVAHDLSPVDLAHVPRKNVIGMATDIGGRTSHVGIVAAAMEIPAVVGIKQLSTKVKTGDPMILDGVHGIVTLNPTPDVLREFRDIKAHYEKSQKSLISERNLPSETEDHHAIQLSANMELMEEIPFILSQGAKGIGLFRTEFFFLHTASPPTEEEQVKYYAHTLKQFAPHDVTIRTYDLGGEKTFGYRIPQSHQELEANPALGLRAIRYCLKDQNLFRTQLRALLRASAHGHLKIMFPLISSLDEFIKAKKIVSEIKEELKKEKIPFSDDVQIGIMIETPAAAMICHDLAEEADFFSVGTNDLIQYTLAVDRVNEHVNYLYHPMHPAILEMLKRVIEAGEKHKIPVNLCGEMAGDPLFLPVLLALGFQSLSLNAIILPRIKHIIRSLNQKECQKILKKVLQFKHAHESNTYLRQEMVRRFPELIELDEHL